MRRFHFLLNHLVSCDKENRYSFSVFENDSKDRTKMWLGALDWSFFDKQYITSVNLNTPFLSDDQRHSASHARVKILSDVRNACINQVGEDLKKYDKVFFLEPECLFYPKDIAKLISLSKDTHIYSPKSVMQKSFMIGDGWATRMTRDDEDYRSVNPALEVGSDFAPLWSTFSYACIYDMKPILEGARFGHWNKRLNRHDCDTVVVCEDFRERGYDKVFMNTNIQVSHI